MRPFYLKGVESLKVLLEEQHMEEMYRKFTRQYKEMTTENTLKILLRCKLAFQARKLLLDIF